MDLAPMKDGLSAVAILISLGGIVYAWVTSRSRVNAEHLILVDEKIAEHRSRLERIETTLSHTPAKDDITEIKLAMAELHGKFGRLDENLIGVTRAVRRMEDYLVQERKQ